MLRHIAWVVLLPLALPLWLVTALPTALWQSHRARRRLRLGGGLRRLALGLGARPRPRPLTLERVA